MIFLSLGIQGSQCARAFEDRLNTALGSRGKALLYLNGPGLAFTTVLGKQFEQRRAENHEASLFCLATAAAFVDQPA